MRDRVKVGLLLAGVFLAGLMAGIVVGRRVLPLPPRALLMQRPAPPGADRLAGRLQTLLDLSDPQTDSVRRVLERRQPRLTEVWAEARTRLLAQVDSTVTELDGVLTPAQRTRLHRLLEARGIRVDGR